MKPGDSKIPRMPQDDLSDEIMTILDNIMKDIQHVELRMLREGCSVGCPSEFFKIVHDHYSRYVEEKAEKDPEWAAAVHRRYEECIEQFRNLDIL